MDAELLCERLVVASHAGDETAANVIDLFLSELHRDPLAVVLLPRDELAITE